MSQMSKKDFDEWRNEVLGRAQSTKIDIEKVIAENKAKETKVKEADKEIIKKLEEEKKNIDEQEKIIKDLKFEKTTFEHFC